MALSLQRYMWPDFNSSLVQLLKERSKKERERSMGIAIEIGDCLNESVIIEILSWLPVKDLLRYKSVCSSWYAIISSPDFITKHLKNHYQNNYDWRGCLLAQYYVTHAELQLFAMLIDETPRVLAHETLFLMPMYASHICGPCDGLYYVYDYDGGKRAIWNPSINEIKVLPPIIMKPDPPLDTTNAKFESYGFGFDPVSKDYKVVVIKGYWSTTAERIDYPQSVLVYSLKNDSWRYCGDLRQHYRFDYYIKSYNFVNGCCYWLESSDFYANDDQKSGVIIGYNLGTDSLEEINLPNYNHPASKSLGIYDDSLAFLSLSENDKRLEIWTLKEGLWTMKFTMGPFQDVRNPVGHWKDNKVIFESKNGNLVVLDHETQDFKDLSFQGTKFCIGIWAYMESLVSIKGVASWNFRPFDKIGDDHSATVHAIETSESDSEFGIHELFDEV